MDPTSQPDRRENSPVSRLLCSEGETQNRFPVTKTIFPNCRFPPVTMRTSGVQFGISLTVKWTRRTSNISMGWSVKSIYLIDQLSKHLQVKINRFPGSFCLCKKDDLVLNYKWLQKRAGFYCIYYKIEINFY